MFTVSEQNWSVTDLKNGLSDFHLSSSSDMSNLNLSESDNTSDLPLALGDEDKEILKIENGTGDRSDSGFGSSGSSQQSTPFMSENKVAQYLSYSILLNLCETFS